MYCITMYCRQYCSRIKRCSRRSDDVAPSPTLPGQREHLRAAKEMIKIEPWGPECRATYIQQNIPLLSPKDSEMILLSSLVIRNENSKARLRPARLINPICSKNLPSIRINSPLQDPSKQASKMVKVHIERVIDVPIERTWEIIADFSNVQVIHPLVETVDQKTPDKDRGVGAVRICNLYDGNKAVEEIVQWDENNHSYKIKLIEGTLPMKEVSAELSVEKVEIRKSKLVADMNMKAKYGLLGKIMERLIIKPQFAAAIGNMFAGVESYDKTGVEIGKGFKAKTPALVA